ncbi:SPOR domain-containing protein [Yoonia sp. GPGPB17]|uniref:SPOR domain-containing protein n=1 Tax=Yoonia sp. GPGPB17 TaxID=3026147 RepID=UPI0030BF393E
MTGFLILNTRRWPLSLALIGAMGLAACDESGGLAFPTSQGATAQTPLPANALNQRPQRNVDIERPDIFAITDNGLWDGRPSLGGVWVAHPEVTDPERVVIRNSESGQEIIGALFRRERENPGPLLQVSSDAAEALGLLPGSPTRLEVVVLRREEVEVEEPENPVVASLETPVAVEEEPLEPAAESADDPSAAAAAAVVLPAAVEAATAAVEETAAASAEAADTVDVSSVLAATSPLPEGANAQIGIYSVEANANAAVGTITAAGIDAAATPQELGGRTVWRVTAGPLSDAADIARLKELGFVDTFLIEDAE